MPAYKHRHRPILVVLAVFAVYALLAFRLTAPERDPDEGINLIKAALLLKGYSLYADIWNDQPPVFTVLLSAFFRVAGPSIEAARILVLAFSCILLWSFHQIIELSLDRRSAALATILLATSWMFARLSLSVMIGVPSLSFALLSIYTSLLSRGNKSMPGVGKGIAFQVLSGGLFALSLQTKLFTIFMVPLYFLLDDGHGSLIKNRVWSKISWFSVWLSAVLFTYILVGLIMGANDYSQLVAPHASQAVRQAFINADLYSKNIKILLQKDFLALFLASLGMLRVLIWSGMSIRLFPLGWLVLANISMFFHKPVWYHHYLLLSIPLCWLSAYGLSSLLSNIKIANMWRGIAQSPILIKAAFSLLSILAALSMYRFHGKTIQARDFKPPFQASRAIVETLLKYRDYTRWLFTDKPILAFENNMNQPPEIAVFTWKRLESGNLNSNALITVLRKYRPEQVVLARFTDQILRINEINAYLTANYTLKYLSPDGSSAQYLRNDLAAWNRAIK